MTNERLMMFTQYLKYGKEGKISGVESKFAKLGIEPNFLRYGYITEYFHNNPHLAVNWDDEIKDMAAKIGFSLGKGGVYHIPVLGYTYSGKTLFSKLIDVMLQKNNIKSIFINARNFSEEEGDMSVYEKILDEAKNYDVIIVDDLWAVEDPLNKILNIARSMEKGAIVTVWRYLNFVNVEEDVFQKFGKTLPPVKLNNMGFEKCEHIFDNLWNVVGKGEGGQKKLIKGVFCKIFEKSDGFVGVAIKIFINIIRKFCMEGSDNLHAFAEENLKKYGLDKMEKLELDEVKLNILRIIITAIDERGVTPSVIGVRIKKDAATVTYHLSKLKNEGIVEDYRFGKNIFYRVRDIYRPFVERIIINLSGKEVVE